MISRRDVLLGIVANSLVAVAWRRSAWAGNAEKTPSTPTRPAYFVQVIAGGGLDTIYGMSPKTPRELDSDIDLPYEPNQIVGTDALRLGPHMASLLPWASQFSIAHGVKTFSVAHSASLAQVSTGKLGLAANAGLPSMVELFGENRDRDRQPASCIHLGLVPFSWRPGPAHIDGGNLFNIIQKLSPRDIGYLIAGLQGQIDQLAGRAKRDVRARSTSEYLRDTVRLLDRIRALPKPEFGDWSKDPTAAPYAASFQQALWLMQNDLTSGITIFHYDWDTHLDNHATQSKHSSALFAMLAKFLEEMAQSRNHRGTLLDNTLLFVGSELGRFPRLNQYNGKHHFPETSYMVMGPGIKKGMSFGATGRQMESLPVDLKTGTPSKHGRTPTLADLSTTVLTAAGVTPEQYGYDGNLLGVLAR